MKETIYRIGNKIRLKGIGFLDSFVDTLCSTTPHHLLMLRTVHFMEASVVDILFVIVMLGVVFIRLIEQQNGNVI